MSDAKLAPVRSIDEEVHFVHKKWDACDRAITKAKDTRLEAAMALRALRERIESGDAGDQAAIDWWGWYADNFARSRSDAEKMLAIAGHVDPPAKIELKREQERAASERYRAKLKVVPKEQDNSRALHDDHATPEPKPLMPKREVEELKPTEADRQGVAQILDIFETLTWQGRKEAVKEINNFYRRQHG